MPDKKRYSASEIAAMRLPKLPTTKARVIERAAREQWPYVDETARGGVRRMYEVPERYFTIAEQTTAPAPIVGTIAGGQRADLDKLRIAVRALEEWAQENNRQIDPDRKSAIVALLYDYLVRGAGTAELANLLRVVQ